jgi:hypothetical protein
MKIKTPGGNNVLNIFDIINDRAAFKKLNKEDEILAGIEMKRSLIKCVNKIPKLLFVIVILVLYI